MGVIPGGEMSTFITTEGLGVSEGRAQATLPDRARCLENPPHSASVSVQLGEDSDAQRKAVLTGVGGLGFRDQRLWVQASVQRSGLSEPVSTCKTRTTPIPQKGGEFQWNDAHTVLRILPPLTVTRSGHEH